MCINRVLDYLDQIMSGLSDIPPDMSGLPRGIETPREAQQTLRRIVDSAPATPGLWRGLGTLNHRRHVAALLTCPSEQNTPEPQTLDLPYATVTLSG